MVGEGVSSASIQKLKEMTDNLPPFASISKEYPGSFVEVEMNAGTCYGFPLFDNKGEVNVCRWFNSAGSVFPEHVHEESTEIIAIYSGSMSLTNGDKTKDYHVGDVAINDKGEPHSAVFNEDTHYITITIPSAEGFP